MSTISYLPTFVFAAAFFYAMGKSKAKVKTALYTLIALAAVIVAACVLNSRMPQHPWVIASLLMLGPIAGMAVALTHSRQTSE